MRQLLRQPLLHFFVVGALLFAVHRAMTDEQTTIVVTPGVKADLARRFQDDTGRPPSPAEAEKALGEWKRSEALYREALRQGLDRNDASIRTLLIEKLRAQAMLEAPKREPSPAELQDWLAGHRSLYEAPRRYTLEWLAFDRANPASLDEREKLLGKLLAGQAPGQLGRPLFGINAGDAELRQRLGARLAQDVTAFPLGEWQKSDSPGELLLVRVTRVEGGLPPAEELEPRLSVDLSMAERRRAAERALDAIASRYRYEEAK